MLPRWVGTVCIGLILAGAVAMVMIAVGLWPQGGRYGLGWP